MTDMKKELERSMEQSRKNGAALASTKVKGPCLAYKIDGVRERSKGDDTNWRAAINRSKDVEFKCKDS